LLLAACLLTIALCSEAPFAGTIYYYEDANGVLHFTDLPDSKSYRPVTSAKASARISRDGILSLVERYSNSYGVDPHLAQAVLEVESDYRPNAVSDKGAQGLMQIRPETQKDLGLQRPFDPEANIAAGVCYLDQLLQRFPEVEFALAAYNAGPGTVDAYDGIPPYPETQRYVRKVLDLYAAYKSEK
jgi:soluble lytic murein transglycosylase-like protein